MKGWRRVGSVVRGTLFALWFTAQSLLIAVTLAFLAYNHHHYNHVYRGISVLGVDVGGLTPAKAYNVLGDQLAAERLPDITLQVANDQIHLPLSAFGAELDLHQAVAEAYSLGRSEGLVRDMQTRARLLWQGYDVVPSFSLDPAAAELALRPLARSESKTAQRERLLVSGLEAHVEPAEAGRSLALQETLSAIETSMQKTLGASGWRDIPRGHDWLMGTVSGGDVVIGQPTPVVMRFQQSAPLLSEVSDAHSKVSSLLSSPLVLVWLPDDTASEERWLIDQATLSSWLALGPADNPKAKGSITLQTAPILTFAQNLATQIDRPPVSGRFLYDADSATLTTLEEEQLGYQLLVDQTAQQIMAAAFSTNREIRLPVQILSPPVTKAELAALLPLDLLGEGNTLFVGSTAEREANIVTASRRLEGVAVAAGETFSMLEVLGPVNRATGYEESWVIFADRTELGAGGGVCQVATTCFRAAFWSGLGIVERHPHAYRVGWYEPPLGLDAAVFEPYVDLKFTNDYDAPLLINVEVDQTAQSLTFRFYGRTDGRRVSMDGPETRNPRPAPEPVYEVDDSLTPGTSVLVERAREGLDVTVVRQISWPDGAVHTEELASAYAPWPARYRIGPETESATNQGGID